MKRKSLNFILAGCVLAIGTAIWTLPTAKANAPATQEISPAGRTAASPDLAVGADGSINLIWVDKGAPRPAVPPPTATAPATGGDHNQHGAPAAAARTHSHKAYYDLYFARSTDGGRTFSTPVRVNSKAGELWGFATSRPRVAVSKSGIIHVFYHGNRRAPSAPRQAVDARYTRSLDGGKTFEAVRTLNAEGKGMDDGELDEAHCFGTMGVAPNGDVHAYWIDTRHMKSAEDNGAIYGVVSRNEGKTFSTEKMIVQSEACPCCQLNVAFSPASKDSKDSKAYLSLRSVGTDGSRNAALKMSADRGQTFSASVAVSDKKWKIAGCPLKPLALSADNKGRVYATWFAGEATPPGVFFAVSTDRGQTFSKPLRLHDTALVSDHSNVVATNDGFVRVVWDAKVGEVKRVYTRTSFDFGKTFGPVQEVDMPAGASEYPVVAAVKGKTYLAWQLNGRIVFQAMNDLVAKH